MNQTGQQLSALEGIDTVQVYVRKGVDDDTRYLTFRFPDWLSQGEALDKGWSIDGNQVLVSVRKKDLLTAERDLVDRFRQMGCGITFC